MTFEELPMYQAIYEERIQMEQNGECPSSDEWTSKEDKRRDLTQRIMTRLIVNADQTILSAWMHYRKSPMVENQRKMELIVKVFIMHGQRCFYSGRGRGDCDGEVNLDRILPETRGGKYTVENCLIACGRHNKMRGDKSIEDFLTERV